MLAAGFLLTFVTGPTAFALTPHRPAGADLDRSQQVVRDALALPAGGNVFRLDTAPLGRRSAALPAVAAAEVSVAPAGRRASSSRSRSASRSSPGRSATPATSPIATGVDLRDGRRAARRCPAGVAVVEDRARRRARHVAAIGGRLDAVDLDVATRLGQPDAGGRRQRRAAAAASRSPTPTASSSPRSGGWTAVFGFYSPATRADRT